MSWLVGRRVERANSRGKGEGDIPTGVAENGNGRERASSLGET